MSEPIHTCEHAETTTLLWLYGEADEAHATHVAGCGACTEVARQHADLMSEVGPIADRLVAAPSAEGQVDPLPAPANRGWWIGVVVGLAAAAAVLLALFGALGMPGDSVTSPAPDLVVEAPIDDAARHELAEALLDEAFGADVDADFEALYDEFDALEADLATL